MRPVVVNCSEDVGAHAGTDLVALGIWLLWAGRAPTGGQWMAGTRDKAGRALRRSNGSRALAAGMKAPVSKSPQLAAKPTRADKSALRRDAIVAAALEEFSARGFAAARLEDVAQRGAVGWAADTHRAGTADRSVRARDLRHRAPQAHPPHHDGRAALPAARGISLSPRRQ